MCRFVGDHPQDPLDVGQEAQVEHAVGLVEHQRADLAEHQVALLGQVEQPARGADDDVDALAQRLDLRLVRAAAVDGQHPRAEVLARVGHVAGDLQAQLAGRHDDQHLRGAVARGGDALQQRHAEAQRLAGAGAGLPDDVLAGQCQRQRQLLDREGSLDAGLGQGLDDLRPDAELGERGGVVADGGAGLERMRRVCFRDAGLAVFQLDRVHFGCVVDELLSLGPARSALDGPLDRTSWCGRAGEARTPSVRGFRKLASWPVYLRRARG